MYIIFLISLQKHRLWIHGGGGGAGAGRGRGHIFQKVRFLMLQLIIIFVCCFFVVVFFGVGFKVSLFCFVVQSMTVEFKHE